MFKYAVVFVIGFAGAASAQQTTVQQSMAFTDCVQSINQTASGLSQQPTTTVDTADRREVVMAVPDGQLTVTCDGVNQQATMTHQR